MASTLFSSGMYAPNTGDVTALRAYGTAISNAFANSGWVKTSDVGQIDWTTVPANGSLTTHGFEIWRMNDALAQTAPCYLKIVYQTLYQTNGPGFTLSLGSGSDGVGELTGATTKTSVGGSIRITASASSSGSYFRGNPGDITLTLFTGQATGFLLNIERLKDANGNDTIDGVSMVYAGTSYNGTSTDIVQVVWSPHMGSPTFENTISAFTPVIVGASNGTKSTLYPIYPARGIHLNPLLNIMYGYYGMVAFNVPIDVTYYGSVKRYFAPTSYDTWANRSSTTANNHRILIRGE